MQLVNSNRVRNPLDHFLRKYVVLQSAKAKRVVLEQHLSGNKASQTLTVSIPDYSEPPDFVLRLNICLPPLYIDCCVVSGLEHFVHLIGPP